MREIRVEPSGKRWAVRRVGSPRNLALTDTQEEAMSIGRQHAWRTRCEFTVLGRDGRIRERDSYGTHPYPG